MDRNDVGMLQLGDRFGFAAKTTNGFRPRQRSERDHLHRYQTIQPHLTRAIDNSHAAATQDCLQQLIVGEASHPRLFLGRSRSEFQLRE